jgi:sulfatase maturation enzyme AslB (radical SAM superfamily)
VCEVLAEKENGVEILLITYVFIDEQYRGKKQCYELVKKTILKHQGSLIKVVIAGGEPILKCLIKVFKDLKYKIKKYKSDDKEDISNLKTITYEDVLKIEKKTKN